MATDNDTDTVKVTDNARAQRFEAQVGQYLAIAEYQRGDGTITFTHTAVPGPIEGRGVASALARTALEQAKAEGLAVIPACSFFVSYIRRHPEYASLVSAVRPSHEGQGEADDR